MTRWLQSFICIICIWYVHLSVWNSYELWTHNGFLANIEYPYNKSQIVGKLRIYCFHENLCISFCFSFNLSVSESDVSSGECCLSCAEYSTFWVYNETAGIFVSKLINYFKLKWINKWVEKCSLLFQYVYNPN